MRILYGVCGEGMGHAIRSAVVGHHLRGLGHDVTYVCSPGRAFDHLARLKTGRVVPTLGLHSTMTRNRVDAPATFLGNAALQMIAGPVVHTVTAAMVGVSAKPDFVISDFEPWSARYASVTRKPLVAIDNIHFATRFSHERGLGACPGDAQARALMEPVVDRMIPGAKRYLVTGFVGTGARPRDEKTSLHLPILRPETLSVPRSVGEHVVVYFNDKADAERLHVLSGLGVPFHVYGTGARVESVQENVTVKPMGPGFLGDLASSRAVIAGAGFTTMTEAIYLGKPMLAVPFEGQYEQILNASYLSEMGYGERAREITREGVGAFLERAETYRTNLSGLVHDGNRALLAELEEMLDAA